MFESSFDLKELNTFKISSKAERYFSFSKATELDAFIKSEPSTLNSWFVLGGGSNVLFTNDFNGVVLHPINESVEIIAKDNTYVVIRAHAGLEWDKFVEICVSNGWQGIENLTLIPGNVGASPVQNIGAYGTEASDHIAAVHCYDIKQQKEITFNKSDASFTYRNSHFKQTPELVVLSVDYKLFAKPMVALFKNGVLKGITNSILQAFTGTVLIFKSIRLGPSTRWKLKMNFQYVRDFLALQVIHPSIKRKLVRFIRNKTMPNPKKIGNVGCFFKSPIVKIQEYDRIKAVDKTIGAHPFTTSELKLSAGDLIRSCEWNGKRLGDVSVETNRPLIILNHGNATGNEIYEFSTKIQSDVFEKFNVNIEPEVVILGVSK